MLEEKYVLLVCRDDGVVSSVGVTHVHTRIIQFKIAFLMVLIILYGMVTYYTCRVPHTLGSKCEASNGNIL